MACQTRELSGVDVILDSSKHSPWCPHGPTLLFEKFSAENKSVRRFYGCSACRDRKGCNFFQWEDERISQARQKAREDYNKSQQPAHAHRYYYHRLKLFQKLEQQERKFCCSCNQILLRDDWPVHQEHTLIEHITSDQLTSPSCLLGPLENNKSNAQYLFSEKAAQFLVQTILNLGGRNIVCVGAPRIHETVQKLKVNKTCVLDSILLDIDHRYEQFFSPSEYCRYNMFNHHFFEGEKSEEVFTNFLKRKDIYLVTDPPFGGLIEVLAANMKKISQVWRSLDSSRGDDCLPFLWIFPYFMEPRMISCLPGVSMLDYKVEYDNHPLYCQKSKGKKRGSPVRIYTNLTAATFTLPQQDGYRFCQPCQRYSAAENVHCNQCQTCPSKDGSTYRHCDQCGRCVKPSRVHCPTCNICVQKDHRCGLLTKNIGCHICGSHDHKRRDCPDKGSGAEKRKINVQKHDVQNRKKKRKGEQKQKRKK